MMLYQNRLRSSLWCVIFLLLLSCNQSASQNNVKTEVKPLRNKVALNAFSFNAYLRQDSIDVFGLMDYCTKIGFDGVDITGYYFPGYPEPPSDEYVYRVKKKGFELGLDICGTGVRNDFCNPDPTIRKQDLELIKKWVLVAEKLGAPTLRLYQGPAVSKDHSWEEMAKWAAEVVIEGAEFGKAHGVVLEIQNHNNFLKTSEDVHKFMKMVDHEWVGLMLDIGSFRAGDPYQEIEATIQYAISWQLKELVYVNQVETPVDLSRIKEIISKSDYKGYLPIETLGPGDPYVKVEQYFNEVSRIFR